MVFFSRQAPLANVKLRAIGNCVGALDESLAVWARRLVYLVFVAALISIWGANLKMKSRTQFKGLDIRPTGLSPVFPAERKCPPITSLYASWLDVDGSRRKEPHSGIDAGKLGDEVLSPGPGIVAAVWQTNFGWGDEGSLLLLHKRSELNLSKGAKYYYSEFDHLVFSEISALEKGDNVARGELLGHVNRPGGKPFYLPEVHWEVYEVNEPRRTQWHTYKSGLKYFTNENASLIDPLFMLSLEHGITDGNQVSIVPFEEGGDYSEFKGFTYILRCKA